MFRRKDVLPMAGSQHGPDGSGRSIHMDAPLWRAWKNSSGYIKGSYIFLVVSLLMVIWGFRFIRYHNASIWLTCYSEECSLEITPVGRVKTIEVEFPRRQLLMAQAIKVTKDGDFVKLDDSPPVPLYRARQGKYQKGEFGPDKEGYFDDYQLVVQAGVPKNTKSSSSDSSDSNDDDKVDESDFRKITPYIRIDDDGRMTIPMRRFNLGQTRRRTRTMVSKVDAFVKQRRHRLTIKENATIRWQGIVALVVGIFVFLLTVLLGQFVEEPKPRQGGPGARRQRASATASKGLTYDARGTTRRKHY